MLMTPDPYRYAIELLDPGSAKGPIKPLDPDRRLTELSDQDKKVVHHIEAGKSLNLNTKSKKSLYLGH